ncbi:MAG: hypothetical protein M3N18_01425 [Actinomycetota bacterium]|nr:hypothetical protein [Actinomycetota bacterium]
MPFREVLQARKVLGEIECRGVTLAPAGERLRFHPKRNLTPELVEELREHKESILRLLKWREIRARDPHPVESVAEVFEMARARFGQSSPSPDERPPSKREFWVNRDKANFFAEVRREDDEWRRRGEYPPHIRPVGPKGGAA